MDVDFRLAVLNDFKNVKQFFDIYFIADETTNPEWLCPDGLLWAIKRESVIVGMNNNKIVGAARFYRRKRDNGFSLYQTAIHPHFSKTELYNKMINAINDKG